MKDPFAELTTFVGHTGIELIEAGADSCLSRTEIRDVHLQPYGVVHGGVYCTIAETISSTGAALWAMENGMAGAVGLSNKTDFLKATTEGVLLGEATPIHRGRSHQIWQVFIRRESDDRLAAQSQVRLQNVTETQFD